MSYVITIRGDNPRRVWKQIQEVVRESGGVRLTFKDYSQLFIPNETLAEINSATLPTNSPQKQEKKKEDKGAKSNAS